MIPVENRCYHESAGGTVWDCGGCDARAYSWCQCHRQRALACGGNGQVCSL